MRSSRCLDIFLALAIAGTVAMLGLELAGLRLMFTWYANGVTAILEPVQSPSWVLALDAALLVVLLGFSASLTRAAGPR